MPIDFELDGYPLILVAYSRGAPHVPSVCICLHMCVHVSACVCMCLYMSVHVSACVYICLYMCAVFLLAPSYSMYMCIRQHAHNKSARTSGGVCHGVIYYTYIRDQCVRMRVDMSKYVCCFYMTLPYIMNMCTKYKTILT